MASENITDLDSVLKNYLGDGKVLKSFETQRFTKAGDNYGSLILSIDLKIVNKKTNREEDLNVVAKKVPLNEMLQKVFQSPVTFKKELGFYQVIIPELHKFQTLTGDKNVLDAFPNFYGGRLGLKNNEVFDNEAIILLENLKNAEYKSIDRTLGYNLEEAKLILKNLAVFHALPICIQSKNSDLYKKKFLPFMGQLNTFSGLDPAFRNSVYDQIVECVKSYPDISAYAGKVLENYKYCESHLSNLTPRKPFATLIHADLWSSNILLKYENPKTPKHVKFVDFQLFYLGSVARDLSFLIFVNLQNHVMQNHYDELIDFYLKHFIDCLKFYKVDTAAITRAAFDKEMAMTIKECTFYQCLVMLYPIFATEDNLIDFDNASDLGDMTSKALPKLHKEKLHVIVKEFIKHGWL